MNQKLKFFYLKNTSIGWRAEQNGVSQAYHRLGSGGFKYYSIPFLICNVTKAFFLLIFLIPSNGYTNDRNIQMAVKMTNFSAKSQKLLCGAKGFAFKPVSAVKRRQFLPWVQAPLSLAKSWLRACL